MSCNALIRILGFPDTMCRESHLMLDDGGCEGKELTFAGGGLHQESGVDKLQSDGVKVK